MSERCDKCLYSVKKHQNSDDYIECSNHEIKKMNELERDDELIVKKDFAIACEKYKPRKGKQK